MTPPGTCEWSQRAAVPIEWLLVPDMFMERVAFELKLRGLTRRWLAHQTGLSPSAIHNLMTGRSRPTAHMLACVIIALDLVELIEPPSPAVNAVYQGQPAQKRLWRVTKKGWIVATVMLGLAADAVGLWDFFSA